ncbi:hypothetical protein Bca52824_000404 [Brassica carinata]|uniref:DUF223 domain-containing protein n=1 Tax=Brassica carinata TaxID=52824 RepID=A0A8X7WG98_BRACI|nr:hypothetical protein Bca52824_000404 [Brassica carinata]
MVASASSLVFDDLRKGFNKKVLARVVHFWEARNINKGGLLMGLELLLIDQKFTHQIIFQHTDHAGHDIERENFRILSYAEFNEALVLISDENFNNGVTNKRIDIHLQLKDGPIVRVTLWGIVAAGFQKKLMESVDKPMVLLDTTMNPRTFRNLQSHT